MTAVLWVRTFRNVKKLIRSGPLLLLPALTLTACETTKQQVAHKEVQLSAAGFIARPADTSARQAMLARLPAHRFVQRTKGQVIHYVYADPTGCNCLYVGTPKAYGAYVRQMQRQHLADQEQMTASTYEDSAWDWRGWGDGFGPGWAYGAGW